MSSSKLRLLLVEDDDYLRDALAMLLAADDREIECCGSAEQALRQLQLQPFDLLLTDISLPGLSGAELARQVLDDHPAIWVVLCSGYPTDGAAALGPRVRSLPKPFEPEQFDAVLAELRSAPGGTA